MMEPTVKRNILLNPGPSTTTDTVKMAQVARISVQGKRNLHRLWRNFAMGC